MFYKANIQSCELDSPGDPWKAYFHAYFTWEQSFESHLQFLIIILNFQTKFNQNYAANKWKYLHSVEFNSVALS